METDSNPQLVKFEPDHMFAFESREHEPEDVLREGLKRMAYFPNISFSAAIDGRIVGCGGLVVYEKGCGYPWVMISDELARYPVWLHRTVGRYYKRCIEIFRVKYLYSEAAICSPRNTRWLQSFGFRAGTEEFSVNGRDYRRYECEVG